MRSSRFQRYSGLLNPRIAIVLIAALALCVAAFVGTRRSAAATPTSGTISEANPVLTYDAGPFNIPNQSPLGLGQLDQGPRCSAQFPCDNFSLTVSLSAGYAALHPNASIKVTLFWTDLGSGQSDYDLYIFRGVVGDLNGSRQADYQAASGANPEVASITPLQDGSNTYSLKIVPYIPTQEIVHVRMELLSGTGGSGFPGFGGADPTVPNAPRYQTYVPPANSSAEVNNGEFNIGFNPKTGRIMAMNSGPIWRLTPGEKLTTAGPECCDALWEDVSNLTTLVGVDPILWTDQKTGRTFASNSTAGTNVIYGYTDNDGDLWNPLSASGPNASSDHETIGSGPLPASLSALSNPVNQGQAVYYCAQTWPVGAAACQASDTLGVSYGPSVPVYDGQTTQCSGIHGHVKVAPDGTAYLPVRDCSGKAGLMVSVDGGVSWTERIIPNSKTQTHGSDPSVAIGADGTLYFSYVADQTSNPQDPTEGHIHVQVSSDRGATWSKDTDLGASHGVRNAVFPEGVAGDSDRAAVGFLGTDRPGDFEGASFPGIWYLFIATTYDRGNTWTIVNATPNDPVQGAGGIWLGGGSNT
ncbi:MAG TPA: sialidase family protein, partial [Pyrinomonadaceae bacterium]|nr:sialidase family protein [Pyrinomonadaceae bacterium]